MRGYVAKQRHRFYAVTYEGIGPITGRDCSGYEVRDVESRLLPCVLEPDGRIHGSTRDAKRHTTLRVARHGKGAL